MLCCSTVQGRRDVRDAQLTSMLRFAIECLVKLFGHHRGRGDGIRRARARGLRTYSSSVWMIGPEILMKVLRREISADDAKKDNRCTLSLSLSLFLCTSDTRLSNEAAIIRYVCLSVMLLLSLALSLVLRCSFLCVPSSYARACRNCTTSPRSREMRAWNGTSRR